MSSTVQLFVFVLALVLGAVLGAAVIHLLNKGKRDAVEQAAQARVAEKETSVVELRAAIETERRTAAEERTAFTVKIDALQGELRAATEARARVDGAAKSYQDLKDQHELKCQEVENYLTRMTKVDQDAAHYKKAAEQAAADKERAIADKQAEADRLIAAKDAALAAQIADVRAAHERLIADKDAAVAQRLQAMQAHCDAQLAEKERHIEQQRTMLAEAEKKLTETFDSLSMKALASVSEQFMKTAKATLEATQTEAKGDLKLKEQAIEGMLKPMQECLDKLGEQCAEMERKRTSAYDAVNAQIERLMNQTGQLSNALRRPTARGSWGEITLRTVVENAGLVEGQDFEVQHTTEAEEGRLRADMVVRLPNKRAIVIDSKTPLDSHREATNCEDEAERQAHLANHARLVKSHIQQLASKSYQSQYDGLDFVVMFLPAESLYQSAMEADPSLVEFAARNRVLLANPMTLVGLLKAVACLLDHERLNKEAHSISKIGQDLYKGVSSYAGHITTLGSHLRRSVETYNKSLGSLERVVLSPARKLTRKGDQELPELEPVESLPATFRAQELAAGDSILALEGGELVEA